MRFMLESTIRIGGREYQLRPPVHEIHVDRPARLEGKFVIPRERQKDRPWETCDGLVDCPDPELHCEDCEWYDGDQVMVRTWDIECVTNILDAEGTVIGFICPGCDLATLLDEAIWLARGRRRCTTLDCDAVVDCGQVLPGW